MTLSWKAGPMNMTKRQNYNLWKSYVLGNLAAVEASLCSSSDSQLLQSFLHSRVLCGDLCSLSLCTCSSSGQARLKTQTHEYLDLFLEPVVFWCVCVWHSLLLKRLSGICRTLGTKCLQMAAPSPGFWIRIAAFFSSKCLGFFECNSIKLEASCLQASFLLASELLCLQLCWGCRSFLFALRVSFLQLKLFCLEWEATKQAVSNKSSTVSKEASAVCERASPNALFLESFLRREYSCVGTKPPLHNFQIIWSMLLLLRLYLASSFGM